MVNLKKKKKWPWLGWGTYFITGMAALVILLVASCVLVLIYSAFTTAPIASSIVTGVIALIVPMGYFVVHILGFKVDE
jgi:hypothetical protein